MAARRGAVDAARRCRVLNRSGGMSREWLRRQSASDQLMAVVVEVGNIGSQEKADPTVISDA